jgi:hypothetical protein
MCPTCGKEPDPKTDAREIGREHDIDLKYLRHCPTCFTALTPEEEERVTRAAMVAGCTVPVD